MQPAMCGLPKEFQKSTDLNFNGWYNVVNWPQCFHSDSNNLHSLVSLLKAGVYH